MADTTDKILDSLDAETALDEEVQANGNRVKRSGLRDRVDALQKLEKREARGSGVRRVRMRLE